MNRNIKVDLKNIKDDEDYKENMKLVYGLRELLFKLFSKDAVIEDEIKFANHLTSYMLQTFSNCIELGMGKKMLPVSVIDVWTIYLGEGEKAFTYRLGAIAGEPYHELNLSRVSQLLEEAVVKWADESWGGIIKAGEEHPKWVIGEEDDGI